MYKEARKQARLSIEEAAFRLHIAPRTLSKYESGELDVHPEMVVKMSELYGTHELPLEHCAKKCPIGRILQPVFKTGSVATDTLRVLKELRDVNECIPGLVEIAADGQIDNRELAEFQAHLKELSELADAIQKLKLLGAKIARGTGKGVAA